jgi:LPS-assembly lipoprotein
MEQSRRRFLTATVQLACLAALSPLLHACGFKPLYGGGNDGTVAGLSQVKIVPIADRSGQLLYNDLRERMNPDGVPGDPLYILEIDLTQLQEDILFATDETPTRTNVVQRAEYTLTRASDDVPVLNGVSQATTGFNILDNEFSTLNSQLDATTRGLGQIAYEITTRVAVFVSDQQPAQQ